jgi:hypothetical protein
MWHQIHRTFAAANKYVPVSLPMAYDENFDLGEWWLEEVREGSSRHLGEGLVGGSEGSERTSAGEGVSELASNKGGDEGGEIGHRLSELDDVLGGWSRRDEDSIDGVHHAVGRSIASSGHVGDLVDLHAGSGSGEYARLICSDCSGHQEYRP